MPNFFSDVSWEASHVSSSFLRNLFSLAALSWLRDILESFTDHAPTCTSSTMWLPDTELLSVVSHHTKWFLFWNQHHISVTHKAFHGICSFKYLFILFYNCDSTKSFILTVICRFSHHSLYWANEYSHYDHQLPKTMLTETLVINGWSRPWRTYPGR